MFQQIDLQVTDIECPFETAENKNLSTQEMFISVLDKNHCGGLVLEHPPCEREFFCSIPGHNGPKSLKLLVVAFRFGAQDDGNSLPVVQET